MIGRPEMIIMEAIAWVLKEQHAQHKIADRIVMMLGSVLLITAAFMAMDTAFQCTAPLLLQAEQWQQMHPRMTVGRV
jgi:hypothetical protein